MPPLAVRLKDFRWRIAGAGSAPLALGLGCAWIGRSGEAGRADDLRLLERAYEHECRFFDTAPAYGESESRLGEFLKHIDRSSVFLATKIEKGGTLHTDPAAWLCEGAERGRERLGVETIDLLQLHDLSFSKLIESNKAEEFAATVEKLRAEGLFRYFGLGMRSHDELGLGLRYDFVDSILSYGNCTPIDTSALSLLADCKATNKVFLNGSPLSSRLLTGANPATLAIRLHDESLRGKAIRFYNFCRERDVGPVAAALQFPLLEDRIDLTLTGPGTVSELESTLQAVRSPLPPRFWEEWEIRRSTIPQNI